MWFLIAMFLGALLFSLAAFMATLLFIYKCGHRVVDRCVNQILKDSDTDLRRSRYDDVHLN